MRGAAEHRPEVMAHPPPPKPGCKAFMAERNPDAKWRIDPIWGLIDKRLAETKL
jgi:hypothetical protein